MTESNLVDTETLELDKTLSIETQLRAQLEAAIADNAALRADLKLSRTLGRVWEARANNRQRKQGQRN